MQPSDGAAARRDLRLRLDAARTAVLARPDRARAPRFTPGFGVSGDPGRGTLLLSLAAVYRILGDRAAAQALISVALREAQATRGAGLRAWRLHSVANERWRVGDKSEARRLFAQAVRVAQAIPAAPVQTALLPHFAHDLRTIYRDEVSARALARRALAPAQALRDRTRKAWAIEAVVEELARAGDLARALPLAKTQEGWERSSLLRKLVDICLERSDFAGAARVIGAFPRDDTARVDALETLCVRQALAGNTVAALETAEGIYEAREWLEALCAAIAARIDAKKLPGTERLLARAGEIAAALEEDFVAVDSLLEFAALQRRAGDPEAAEKTLLRVEQTAEKNPVLATRLFAAVAKARGQGGDAAGAARCLERAWQALRPEEDTASRVSGLSAIAQAQQVAGDREGARKTLREALQRLPKVPSEDRGLYQSTIADTQVALGDYAAAIQTLRTYPDPLFSDGLRLQEILAAQARAGDSEGAIQNGKYLAAQERTEALSRIARERVDAKDWAGARKALEAIAAPAERFGAMAHLAGGLAQAQDIPGALRVADRIEDLSTRIEALERIARALTQAVQ